MLNANIAAMGIHSSPKHLALSHSLNNFVCEAKTNSQLQYRLCTLQSPSACRISTATPSIRAITESKFNAIHYFTSISDAPLIL